MKARSLKKRATSQTTIRYSRVRCIYRTYTANDRSKLLTKTLLNEVCSLLLLFFRYEFVYLGKR